MKKPTEQKDVEDIIDLAAYTLLPSYGTRGSILNETKTVKKKSHLAEYIGSSVDQILSTYYAWINIIPT